MQKLDKMIKSYFFILFCLFLSFGLNGQDLKKISLKEAYALLESQYPALQNGEVLKQIHQKELSILDITRKPTIYLNGEGRAQSESVHLNSEGVMLPFEIDQPLVSVKAYVEAQYLILDGGLKEAQSKLKTTQLNADLQNIEVDKYALRRRINQLFLGISSLREQSKLLDISLKDLQSRKERVVAGVEFGTLLESELTKMQVKELELKTRQDNLAYLLSGLVKTLGDLTGKTISNEVELEFPNLPAPSNISEIHRPEQQLFQFQREAILAHADLIETSKRPRLSAFAQAGVGYPNPLNFLENNVAPYGVIGAKFSWKLTDWKKSEMDKEILTLQALRLQNAEKTFEFNLDTQKSQYLEAVNRLQNQIKNEEQIAQLQAVILAQMAAQLDEGIITSSDYLIQLNAELSARQNVVIHQTELLKTQLEFWNERGGE